MTTPITLDMNTIRESADQACNFMKVLANADRLLLLCQLSAGEKSVGELETLLNIRQPTLSQQLTVLRENQLVSTRRDGKNIYYSISSEPALAIMHVLSQQLCNLSN
jgi:DNA-binding transcriptional ArsR family regulator